jgi:hypothetical protein
VKPVCRQADIPVGSAGSRLLALVEAIEMTITDCIPHTDWFGIFTGMALFAAGVVLTTTVVGAVVGIPMLLASLELFSNPTTLRGTPCAS